MNKFLPNKYVSTIIIKVICLVFIRAIVSQKYLFFENVIG